MKLSNTPLRIRLSMTAFLVLYVLAFSSCKKEDPIVGLKTLPDGDALSIGKEIIYPTVQLFPADSILTDELAESFIGNHSDLYFGEAQSTFYTQLELPDNNFDLGELTNITLDSIVLVLRTTGRYEGELSDQIFSVFKLTEAIYVDSLYYSNDSKEYDSSLNYVLNEGVSIPLRNDSSVFNNKLTEEIRIPLDNELGQSFIDISGTETATNDESFQEFFKGLVVVSETQNGAIVGVNSDNELTGIHLYYRDNTETEEDTLSVIFPIDNGSAYFNNITRDYTNTNLNSLSQGIESNKRIYLQGAEGVMAKLDLSSLPTEIIGNEKSLISTAELIIPVTKSLNTGHILPSLLFISSGNSPDSLNILEDEITSFPIDGFYDSTIGSYRFSIPYHLQNIINEDLTLDPLWISVNPAERLRGFMNNLVSYSDRIVEQRRVVLNGPQYSSSNTEQNMRLILTYSE